MKGNLAKHLDITAKRYGKTPSQLLGLTDQFGNPDRYFGLMVDMALAMKFDLEDKDEVDVNIWQINQYIASVGKALKMKYPGSTKKPPKPRLEQIQDNLRKENTKVAMPTEVPTQAELFKKWNIKM